MIHPSVSPFIISLAINSMICGKMQMQMQIQMRMLFWTNEAQINQFVFV
jgi:hypothetical protein